MFEFTFPEDMPTRGPVPSELLTESQKAELLAGGMSLLPLQFDIFVSDEVKNPIWRETSPMTWSLRYMAAELKSQGICAEFSLCELPQASEVIREWLEFPEHSFSLFEPTLPTGVRKKLFLLRLHLLDLTGLVMFVTNAAAACMTPTGQSQPFRIAVPVGGVVVAFLPM